MAKEIHGLTNCFFSLAPKESFFPSKQENHSAETLVKIIEELKRSDEAAAKQLFIALQNDLDKLKNDSP